MNTVMSLAAAVLVFHLAPLGLRAEVAAGSFVSSSSPVAAPLAADAARAADAPSEETIKAQLEKFWGRERVKNTYQYKTLKIAKARKGEYRTDGVPANSHTMVYPVKVVCDHTVEYQDGTTKTETKSQEFVFFQDEFGDWTFRFKGNV